MDPGAGVRIRGRGSRGRRRLRGRVQLLHRRANSPLRRKTGSAATSFSFPASDEPTNISTAAAAFSFPACDGHLCCRRLLLPSSRASGAGKSRLAVDLAGHFTGVEVLSADSMQVYRGLDVLTNKFDLNGVALAFPGVPHHLLNVTDPSVEFTCRDFRVHAVPIIQDILDRGGLPVVVGGTNFYIQALVSPFLFDDMVDEMQYCTVSDHLDDIDLANDDEDSGYESLKEIDPVAVQRIHPNDHRKIRRYLELYATTGALPSDLFQGEAAAVRIFFYFLSICRLILSGNCFYQICTSPNEVHRCISPPPISLRPSLPPTCLRCSNAAPSSLPRHCRAEERQGNVLIRRYILSSPPPPLLLRDLIPIGNLAYLELLLHVRFGM